MRWLLRLGIAAAVVVALNALPHQQAARKGEGKLGAMQQELVRAQAEISRMEDDIVSRRRHVEALKTDTRTVETIARQELHMLYPHEKMLRLGNAANRIEGGP